MDKSDELKYIEELESRYRYSETEEGLVINKLISMYKKLNEHLLRDELTGLYNRKAIKPYFERILTSDDPVDRNTSFTIIIIDLDHFKSVNDTYGHNVGDDVLQIVAEGMIRTFKKSDLTVRDGGDEFLIVVRNIDLQVLLYKAEIMSNYITECIHKELEGKVNEFGMPITRPHDYTISLGVREMDLSKLDNVKDEIEFKAWFKEEKEYADKEAYIQKEKHHSLRR